MSQVYEIPGRLTDEERLQRWNEARDAFMANPCHDARERMLQRYAAFYRALCNGSSVGLDDELEKMEAGADQIIAAAEARRGRAHP